MSTFTPGPWSACRNGDCSCKTVSCGDHPICNVISGEWGDDYPAIRLVGDSSLDLKAEAFMDQITYGTVHPDTAKANARLIAAAPELLAALKAWRNPDVSDAEANRLTAEAIAKAEGSQP